MKSRGSLLALGALMTLAAFVAVADQDSSAVLELAAVGSVGCAADPLAEAPADLDLDLFGPAPLSLVNGSCGSCSTYPCAGRAVGSPCGVINGEFTWCIPANTLHCPGGGSANWDCSCANHYN